MKKANSETFYANDRAIELTVIGAHGRVTIDYTTLAGEAEHFTFTPDQARALSVKLQTAADVADGLTLYVPPAGPVATR